MVKLSVRMVNTEIQRVKSKKAHMH